jgi:hypothetical protein
MDFGSPVFFPSKLGGENKVDAEDLDFYPGCPTIILFFPELEVGVREGERPYANGRINRETSFSSPKKRHSSAIGTNN